MAKKQALGRGLDNIFGDNSAEERNGVTMLRISELEPRSDQPRKVFDKEALAELADSISVHGILQPILVREGSLGMYEIIAGERRWRAAKQAGLSEVPVLVIEADDLKAAEVALIENIQREDLDPFEEAAAYVELMQTHGMTQEDVASKLGKRRSTVTNTIRLLDLPAEVVSFVREGRISASHGRTLLGLNDQSKILSLAEKIARRKLSVRETEAAVKRENKASAEEQKGKIPESAVAVDYIGELERYILSAGGYKAHIAAAKGRKVIQIEFSSNEELEEIAAKLCGGSLDL